MKIIVYGRPAPQGSKKFVGVVAGRGRMVENSPHVGTWREDVRQACVKAIEETPSFVRYDEPLSVGMVFTMAKPKSAPKTRRTYPGKMPDLSKLIRSTEDAITSAGVWRDDALVVEYFRAAKVYPGEDAWALPTPGAVIVIRTAAELALGEDWILGETRVA
jgi:crossover junction endodeoxyribonuclease RusA